MKKYFIITNEHKDVNLSVTRSIQDYIIAKGGTCSFYSSTKDDWDKRTLQNIKREEVDAECIIVLGGDGTLVRAARDMAQLNIPLIGVNLGTLGYLCELEKSTIFPALDQIFKDRYDIENRMLIEGTGDITSENVIYTKALNDVVLHRCGESQIINCVISVNGEYLATYNADGIIVSTPTGSTGYSMSAGGPIVDPKADLFVITPINPHSISAKSIIVGSESVIDIMLTERRQERDEEAEVSFDGDTYIHMKVGDRIRIRKSETSAKILKVNQLSFLQILRKKMQEYR